jgi:subtilisin family serine protease
MLLILESLLCTLYSLCRWPQMWYLNRGNHLDMNVQEAWLLGATGKGISVTILDDGIERTHSDLVENYDSLASSDVN